MSIYGRGGSAQSSSHTEAQRLTSRQGFIQTCQDNPNFIYGISLVPKVKTALEGKRFQDVEDIKSNVRGQINAVPLKDLLTLFKILLVDSTNV
jgi:hypothetical protein